MESAVELGVTSTMPSSSARLVIADVQLESVAPIMADAPSLSSELKPETASAGVPWSSLVESFTVAPRMPPAALISSIASWMEFVIARP